MAFTADVTGTVNPGVYWGIVGGTSGGGSDSGSVDRGTITNAGVYTAPSAPGTYQVVAKSQQAPSASDTATITVVADGTVPVVRGTISETTPGSGRIFVTVDDWQGGTTTLLAPGPFVIRGVNIYGSTPSITVKAYRDTAGVSRYLASVDSYGQTVVPWNGSSATGADIILNDPGPPTFSSGPAALEVSPEDGGAILRWDTVETPNNDEYPQFYRVYASTSPTPGPDAGTSIVKTVRAGLLPSTILEPLTNGMSYYFAVSAVTGNVESPLSPIAGPIMIGAPQGGHAVSGTVNVGFVPAGVLYVVVGEGRKVWLQRIPNYQASQAFQVTGVPDGRYDVGALIDLNSNGEIDSNDPLTFRRDGNGIPVTVAGSDVTGVALTMPGGDGLATVVTGYEASGSNAPDYRLQVAATSNAKQVAKATLISGPNVVGPIDLRRTFNPFSSFGFELHPSVTPVLGDTYGLEVTYDDGETCNLDAAVTGVWSSLPTALQPIGADGGSATPTFIWLAPGVAPPSFTYQLNVWEQSGTTNTGDIWFTELPGSASSAVYDDNGSANPAFLSSGHTYAWKIQARDSFGNIASHEVTFTVP
jgi:hypothetical protein